MTVAVGLYIVPCISLYSGLSRDKYARHYSDFIKRYHFIYKIAIWYTMSSSLHQAMMDGYSYLYLNSVAQNLVINHPRSKIKNNRVPQLTPCVLPGHHTKRRTKPDK